MNRLPKAAVALLLLTAAGCRTGTPVYDSTPRNKTTPGTIAGTVHNPGGQPLVGRLVTAIQVGTTQRYSARSGVTGGFSIPVPPGKYRLEVELREGETVVSQPGVVDINESDLDANLEIVVS